MSLCVPLCMSIMCVFIPRKCFFFLSVFTTQNLGKFVRTQAFDAAFSVCVCLSLCPVVSKLSSKYRICYIRVLTIECGFTECHWLFCWEMPGIMSGVAAKPQLSLALAAATPWGPVKTGWEPRRWKGQRQQWWKPLTAEFTGRGCWFLISFFKKWWCSEGANRGAGGAGGMLKLYW